MAKREWGVINSVNCIIHYIKTCSLLYKNKFNRAMIQYIILFSIKCINIATTLRGDMAKVLSSEKKILVTVTV